MSTLEEQAIKTAGKATESVLNKLLGPSAELLGNGLANYLKDKLANSPYWGEETKKAQEENVKDTMNVFLENFNKIDDKDKKQLSVNIDAPVIDSLFTYFEEPNYKEMFGKLLASSFDKNKEHQIHPSFVSIIQQLNSLDAEILVMIKSADSLPYAKFFGVHEKNRTLTPFIPDMFALPESENYSDFDVIAAVENLERLKLITIRKDIVCFDEAYESFKQRTKYKLFEETMRRENGYLRMDKYRVELTQLGSNFVSVCC